MNNKLLLIKDLIEEIPAKEWDDVRDELLSILLFSDFDKALGTVDQETGLNEYEVKLIKKLADQTEKLYNLYKEQSGNNNNQ